MALYLLQKSQLLERVYMSSDKQDKLILITSISLFLLLSIVFLFSLYSKVVSAVELSSPIEEKIANYQAGNQSAIADRSYSLGSIINAKFFYIKPDQKTTVVAKKTQLRLKLQGIIAAEDDNYSRAIISANSKKSETYQVGDKINGTNASLDKVEADRVLLLRSGVMESLELERKKIQ